MRHLTHGLAGGAPDGRRFALANDGIVPVIWQVAGDLPHLVP